MPDCFETDRITEDTHRLTAYAPLPGLGLLPVNAFLIRAAQPVLVDTGLGSLRDSFMQALGSLMDPAELRWIWVTHMDADHIGNLQAVLDAAPYARLVTTYLGMGKAGLMGLPLERCYLLNPGQSLHVGDRELLALKPPVFDAPETTGLLDRRSGTLISSDSFGALLQAPADDARAIAEDALREGMRLWSSVDAPWLQVTSERKFHASLDKIAALKPSHLLSSHLPPADSSMLDALVANLKAAPAAPSFVGPDQAQLELMLASA